MPIAFFTRTQTGALDQPAEQRRGRRAERRHQHARQRGQQRRRAGHHADRDARPRVALTLLALIVLPLFIVPAKRVGKRLQAIARQQHEHQRRDELADDRAVQRRRRPARQAVRPVRRRDRRCSPRGPRRVRDIGIKSAMYGRVFFVALGLVGALGAAAIYGIGAQPGGQRQHPSRARSSPSPRSSPGSTNRSPASPTRAST